MPFENVNGRGFPGAGKQFSIKFVSGFDSWLDCAERSPVEPSP